MKTNEICKLKIALFKVYLFLREEELLPLLHKFYLKKNDLR